MPRTELSSRAAAPAVAAVLALVALLLAHQQLSLSARPRAALAVVAALFVVYPLACGQLQRVRVDVATRGAVLVGAVLQLLAVRTPPLGSDDYLRYAWDGRVQASGTDPYRYPPGAPQLASLRDAWLFPDGVTPRLNHPDDRTIYPPVAQAWFWLVHVVTGGHAQGRGLQVGAAILAVATSLAIVKVLRCNGSDPRRVAWWAWCPTVVLEAGGNAHVDVLAALLTVVALGLLASRRWAAGGVLLGLAVATKVLPALVGAAVPPRRTFRVALAAVGAVAVVYLPHVLVLGGDVTGFLGGYLSEESRDRFALVRFLLPDVLVTPVSTLLIALTALAVWRAADVDERTGRAPRPWAHAAALVGVTFVLVAPPYPWYALLLVPLVALGARPVWLAVAAAPYLVYAAALFRGVPLFDGSGLLGDAYAGTRVLGYGAAVVVLAVAGVVHVRTRDGRGSTASR